MRTLKFAGVSENDKTWVQCYVKGEGVYVVPSGRKVRVWSTGKVEYIARGRRDPLSGTPFYLGRP